MDELEPTSSIAESLDLDDTSTDVVTDLDLFPSKLKMQGTEIMAQFQAMQDQYSAKITTDAFNSLSSSVNRDEYLKQLAQRLYEEIHKAARKYIKNWCAVNRYRQRWSNPFSKPFGAKFVRENSEFIPQVYTLSVFSEDGTEKVLAYMAKTAREATITGAKLLNFDSSTERALALRKFPSQDVDEILNDPSYLKDAIALYVYFEHRSQVERRNYIKSHIRERWLGEIEKEFTQRNGAI